MNFAQKRSLLLIGAAVVATGLFLQRSSTSADTQKKGGKDKPALQKFMRAKLNAANNVLEGLVTEDFKLIAKGAAKLQSIGSDEQWRISNDMMYRQHSNEYQRKVKRLAKMAKEEELEGTALTYVEVTMSCIECHKWVRAVLVADH